MCYEDRFYKDCGHLSHKKLVFCSRGRIDLLTGDYIGCKAFYASNRTEYAVTKLPGYCDSYECWLASRVRYGWRCHKCSQTNPKKEGRFCRGSDCGHQYPTMCYIEDYLKECGHFWPERIIYCDRHGRNLNHVGPERRPCKSFDPDTCRTTIPVPGHCDNEVCWRVSQVKSDWTCHRCARRD
ncbi:hypothetical protein MCOR33_006729 [Pyricularia grisea]|uniref:Uncharacterized protein n=1 Tax=Pyricularia grisea TaxID=148305 RepID=A0ABQ8NGM6_PYRGI|nr:hypothetical protein MCOR33_006729 [Pyricularia grisea]